jgi:hypothetical protein
LSKTEQNYPNLHREAIVFTLTKFNKYIYGKKIKVYTDNGPLAKIFNLKKGIPSLIAARLQKYAYIISIYDFEIFHRPGRKICNADALSRLPLSCPSGIDAFINSIHEIAGSFPLDLDMISRETKKDKVLSKVVYLVLNGLNEINCRDNDLLYFINVLEGLS